MDLVSGALQGVFRWVVYTSAMTSLLIGIVLVVRILFKERLGAQWQYALWILVVLRLVVPWFPSTSFSVYNAIPIQNPRTIVAPVPAAPAPGPAEPSLPTQFGDTNTPTVVTSDQPNILPPISQSSGSRIELPTLIKAASWLWLAGVILLGARSWMVNRRFTRRVAKGMVVANPQTIELFARCRQEVSITDQVELVETPAVKSPALFGLWRPKLVIPPYLHETLGSGQLRYTFLHEMAHLKRHDILVSWVMNLLTICHWFNPLIAYAHTCLREDQELACDSSVLAVVKAEDPKEYAHTIISMLEYFAASPQLPTLAGITSNKSQIKRRLTMINLFRGRSWAWSALGLVVVVTLALVALTNGKNQVTADPANVNTPPAASDPGPAATAPNATVPTDADAVVYQNTQYGFSFTLPADWKGYSVVSSPWQGLAIGGSSGENAVATGPMISIRDPRWTQETPRQDIPIMVFTVDQWNSLQKGDFHIGAAPIGPSELGRNSAYVFALPARYNYAFPAGYEEVETILAGKPLHVENPTTASKPASEAAQGLITNIMQLAQQGKVLGIEFPAKTTTIDAVEKQWGKADQQDWIPAAKGTYSAYTTRGAAFGWNKGMQIFEVRTFDNQLKQLPLSQVKAVLGAPAYTAQANGETIVGYVVNQEFKVLFVFQPRTGGSDPVLDHYSVLYPAGTVNSMANDPGREW